MITSSREIDVDLAGCVQCGMSTTWENCWYCLGAGYFDDAHDFDPLFYPPDYVETCEICKGAGGWDVCLSCGAINTKERT